MSVRALVLLALLLASAPRAGLAVVPSVTEAAAPRSVEVEVVGQADEAHLLQASLAELLGRIGLELRVTVVERPQPQAPFSPHAVVLARVDLRDKGSASVLLTRPGSDEGTPRVVPQHDSRELLLEETALVIYAGAESLTQVPPSTTSEAIAAFPEPRAPPAATPPAQPARPPSAPPIPKHALAGPVRDVGGTREVTDLRPSWLLEGAVLINAQAFATDAWAVGGLEVGARARFGAQRWVPGFWFFGAFHFPFRDTATSAELSTSVWSLKLVPALELMQSRSFRLELGAGVGADVFVIAPDSSVAGADISPHRRDVSALLTGLLMASFATGHGSRFVFGASLDCDLAPRRYTVAHGAARTVLLEPLLLRPGLSLGFSFEAARGERR